MIIYLIKLFPVFFALTLVCCGLAIKDRPRGKIKNGIPAVATIVDFAMRTGVYKRNEYRTKSPIVEFMTENGLITAVYPHFVHEDRINCRVGDVVNICYDKKNTNRFHIEGDGSKTNTSFMIVCLGIFILISYCAVLIMYC